MSKKIKTIFVGTPDFGAPSLRALVESNVFELVSVITQPDKKIGRKQVVTPPAIKVEAQKYNIPVMQPEKINTAYAEIKKINPELVVVIAYAQIISEELLNLPKFGFVNVHGSLLPKYRGAACIQAAILNGDTETGVTIMKMDTGLDTGPIIEQAKIPITECDTGGTLFMKLSELGGKILVPTLKKYINNEIKLLPQENSQASYVGLLKKEDGEIDWQDSARKIERHVRAMSPWPGAFSKIKIKEKLRILKIIKAKTDSSIISNSEPGKIFLDDSRLCVQCGKEVLVIERLQLAGKKEMPATDFIQGHRNLIGATL